MTTSDVSLALQTDKISKHFGAVRAVDELSLSIPRQGTTSIVGPNGSGKSTLVNLLSGVLPLDGGMVIIDGAGLRVVRAHETPAHGLTRTFQEVRLFDQITVWDNIMVVLTERRLFPSLVERVKPATRQKAQHILESVGMWEKRDSLAMELSYGQRKLLEIGRAMAMNVQTYLFDEAFSPGLFPQMLERVEDIMKQMRADGHTIVFVSHNMDIVRELSDRIIVLDSGTLLAAGDVEPSPGKRRGYRGVFGARDDASFGVGDGQEHGKHCRRAAAGVGRYLRGIRRRKGAGRHIHGRPKGRGSGGDGAKRGWQVHGAEGHHGTGPGDAR